MRKAYLLLAFALAAPAAAILSSASPPAADKIARCSLQNREFWYYAPAALSPLRPAPLVLSYHGAGSDGRRELDLWQPLAAQYGFIVACPTSRLAGAGQAVGARRLVSAAEFEAETATALAIVEYLRRHFAIDAQRVMVTGFSGGGNVAYWLAFTQPDIFPFFCSRSANFPARLRRYADTAAGQAQVRRAAAQSRIGIFWGEADHPLVCAELPDTLAWIKQWQPRFCLLEELPGGHQPHAARAALWFVSAAQIIR